MKPNLTQLITIVTLVFLAACQSTPVKISESQLLGDWQSLTDDQLNISFSISDSGQLYHSYIDSKIDKQAHWKLNGNKLVIDDGQAESEEIEITLNDDTLVFVKDNEPFVRLTLQNEPETDTMDQSFDIIDDINDNLGLMFTSLKTITEPELPVTYQWQAMKCKVALESNDMESVNQTCEQIISLLTLQGYEPDSILFGKKWLVYGNKKQKIIIRYTTPESPVQGDSLPLEIICGTR